MHELFTKVLAKRDLSRAGDLFAVADSEIVADLTDVVSQIRSKKIVFNPPDHALLSHSCLVGGRYISTSRHVVPAAHQLYYYSCE